LIDVADPLSQFDAARFAKLAEAALARIREQGKRPIVCGGTFLWIRALLYGLAPAPPANPELRAHHQARAEALGRSALHADLARVDPKLAERLAPNDLVRVSRALEVYELTGVPLSQWQAEHGFRVARHAARLIGVRREREELARRIEVRTRAMLDAGWVDEVRSLCERGYASARAMSSVGYRQIRDALSDAGTPSKDELCERIARATRIFARRQRTWLRDQPVEWVDASDAPRIAVEG
jgi:tRNA dimethylallyltransferase